MNLLEFESALNSKLLNLFKPWLFDQQKFFGCPMPRFKESIIYALEVHLRIGNLNFIKN